MKPLFSIVVAILVITASAHPENIEEVKELPQSKEPVVEAEASAPQVRSERCTTCSSSINLKSPQDIFAAIKSVPNAEVHTQESFEGCSSEKGCAGLKVKDGRVIEKFGNLQAFKAAANANTGNEFQFQAAGNSVFEGGVPNGGPFWWMNQDSPFKNGAGGGGSFEKFSKSSSSYSSSSNGGAGGVDLAANPFLNGDFAKLGGASFSGAGGNFAGSQSFQSSSANKEIDISKNPFLNGGLQGAGFGGQSGFSSSSQSAFNSQNGFGSASGGLGGAQGSFGGAQGSQSGFGGAQTSQSGFGGAQSSQSGFGGAQGSQSGSGGGQSGYNSYNSASKFSSTGYTGSSPSPFATSTGSNVNLIQNTQKSEYDYQQQQQTQQNIDDIFQSIGSFQAQGNSGGDLQQTCAGQGYVCVLKSQCNNGVVNSNGAGLLQANNQKQFCNTRTETCCRIETSSLAGAGSTTFQGASNQGSGVFSQSGSGQASQSSFGASGFGTGQTTNTGYNAGSKGSSGFATSQFGGGSSFGSNKFGSTASSYRPTTPTPSFGTNNYNNGGFKSTTQSNFVETDSFSAGSENAGVFRPGSSGSGLKPGIPYLPPVEPTAGGSNVVSSTYTPSFIVTTPRPFSTPRPVTTPRPYSTPRPTYLPPVSTKAPEYLPPVDGITGSDSFQDPHYVDGGLILDETLPERPNIRPPRPPQPPQNNDVPAGCAAALKCTPIEYCTAEGVISTSPVALTRDQEAYRVPLTDCKDLESGRIGKCCRDPLYTDPWPTNQLGKWVPGVFGGNDGKYVPDSRVSPNNPQPGVTVRPAVTGSVYLNNFLPKQTTPQRPNQVTPGFPSTTPVPTFVQTTSQGSYLQGGKGSYGQGGQGQYTLVGQGSNGFTQTTGAYGQGEGQVITQGGGQIIRQGEGQIIRQGEGQIIRQGGGQVVTQGGGQIVRQGGGQVVTQGGGQIVRQGGGQVVSQGGGQIVRQGGGQVSQNGGFGVIQGGGVGVNQGGGQIVRQSGGTGVTRGEGFIVTQGGGQTVSQGFGSGIRQGGGQTISQGFGSGVRQGGGQTVSQGFGSGIRQGGGQTVSQGFGSGVRQGNGFEVTQEGGFGINQGGGFKVSQGGGQGFQQQFGQKLIQGEGQEITQGLVSGVRQGSGFTVSNGGYGVENEVSESIQRVYLPRYTGSGECGVLNPLKPYGNKKDLEVDFAEIPWQAMVLLQTNRSLLCGGVITRPDVVITSASCVEGLEAKNVLIKGGEWKLGIDEEPLPFQIVQVKHILRHPQYKAGIFRYDAAILVLTENLRLAKNIWPICLPSSTDNLDAFYNGAGECIVTGWGKSVLQSHLLGSVMHSMNVSLLNPGECEKKITSDYPHLLEHYDQDSCVCGQPTNPANNICKVDIGSALACTTDDSHFVLRGVYSWDSGCQTGNQLASFYRFDLEWYEWAIGLIESVRFSQYTVTTFGSGVKSTFGSGVGSTFGTGVKSTFGSGVKSTFGSGVGSTFGTGVKSTFGSGVKSTFGSGVKSTFGTGAQGSSGIKGTATSGATAIAGSGLGINGFGLEGQSQSGEYSQFGSTKFGSGSTKFAESGEFGSEIKGPIQNTFSATYSEKKFFQTEPKIVTYTTKPEIVTYTTKPEIVTYTTKPEIVTFTTKPEYFTYTTKPKIVSYTTKPEIVTYTTKPKIVTYTTKPEIVTYTTKPEIVSYTTKPEVYTYTTKPKIVSYTTKPQIIRYDYQTSGSQTNQQIVPPEVSFNPSFSEVVGAGHVHDAKCKCLENGKK